MRGFEDPRYVTAAGDPAGTVTAQASQLSGFVTILVPTASLGGVPGPGWSFTVVLHGQDGFGQDGARVFTPTPREFTFGVCAAGGTDPRCALDPALAPKAMDVLTPAGVDQSVELDRTRTTAPVVLRGVPIP